MRIMDKKILNEECFQQKVGYYTFILVYPSGVGIILEH